MNKAKYGITRVRYKKTDKSKFIERVEYGILEYNKTGWLLENIDQTDRLAIIKQVESELGSVVTIKPTKPRKIGAVVISVEIDGEKYLKTQSNSTKEDNLGELPIF